jgi:hypothetical protein
MHRHTLIYTQRKGQLHIFQRFMVLKFSDKKVLDMKFSMIIVEIQKIRRKSSKYLKRK